MCSVEEDDVETNFMKNELGMSDLTNTVCKKCAAQKANVLLRKKDAYCNICFLAYVIHKFRASLGKTKLVRHGENVLIAFSGDAASCALVNLVKTGLSELTHKKLRFEPFILYIDEGVVFNDSPIERKERRVQIQDLLKSENIPAYTSSIYEVLKPTPVCTNIHEEPVINTELESQLKELFTSVTSLTAKQDLLKKLRQRLLLNCAKELNCSFVFVAETATKLAANLLSRVSLGGGSHLSSDIGFCDSRDSVRILRPMRDFMSDDLNAFISINNIPHLSHNSLSKDSNPYASIQSLTKKFVVDVQENFPATISTILRTGEKMENISNNAGYEEDACAMCQASLDTQQIACSALQATEYSRMISNIQKIVCTSEDTTITENQQRKCGDCNCQKSENSTLTRLEVENFLCYSCRLLIKDIRNTNLLPLPLISAIRLKKSLQETRNEIKDFLL